MADFPVLTIPDNDLGTLDRAYKILRDGRKGMIAGFGEGANEQHPYYCALIVDALITGLMAHFHELARNQANHPEINGKLDNFVSTAANQVVADFTQLPGVKSPAMQAPPENRPPRKGRDGTVPRA